MNLRPCLILSQLLASTPKFLGILAPEMDRCVPGLGPNRLAELLMAKGETKPPNVCTERCYYSLWASASVGSSCVWSSERAVELPLNAQDRTTFPPSSGWLALGVAIIVQ